MTMINVNDIDTGWGESLFPPQGKEKAELAIKKLRELLEREYKMREWVFRQDSKKKDQKLKEITEAYQALRDIEEVLNELGGRNE